MKILKHSKINVFVAKISGFDSRLVHSYKKPVIQQNQGIDADFTGFLFCSKIAKMILNCTFASNFLSRNLSRINLRDC